MVELKAKVGPKGQVVIPKVLRERYGINKGDFITIELTENGMLVRGRPSIDEVIRLWNEYGQKLRTKKVKTPKLGELAGVSLEDEFE